MPTAPSPRLDSHQHFWKYDTAQYPWIPQGTPLQRDWLPDDLAAEQAKVDLHGSIAVQARQTLEESRWLLALSDASPVIRGVVGWVDLRGKKVAEDLAELVRHPKFAGVRHVVQDEPEDNFMLRPEFRAGIEALKQFGLTYDLLIFPRQLPAAIDLVNLYPDQAFVLDHLAKPFIKAGTLHPWEEEICELARATNVCCKVSGLVTEADHAAWQPDHFRPYLDTVFEAFGPGRLMFGSDWPVCLLGGSYGQIYQLVEEYTRGLSDSDREAVFGETAAKFYGVDDATA
jgi:L-fuconolactonase